MIDKENIPNAMVSRLSTKMLDFVTSEINHRYLKEIGDLFFNQLENLEKMDKTLTSEQENELNEVEIFGDAKSSDVPSSKDTGSVQCYLRRNNRKLVRASELYFSLCLMLQKEHHNHSIKC